MVKTKEKASNYLQKTCACCGRKIGVILYKNRAYRGGHYFGKIPLCSKKETEKALRAGTKKININSFIFNVLKKSPRPHTLAGYWECPGCYWR